MHVYGTSALKCGHCADFATGSSWIPAVTWMLHWPAESCFVWTWLLLRCASDIIHFRASFMTMDLFGQCDCAYVAWFLSFSIKIWGIGWIWSRVCVCCSSEQPDLSQWLNITSLQMKALLSAHRKAKVADAGGVDMDGVNDCPPPDGFKLDYTPK